MTIEEQNEKVQEIMKALSQAFCLYDHIPSKTIGHALGCHASEGVFGDLPKEDREKIIFGAGLIDVALSIQVDNSTKLFPTIYENPKERFMHIARNKAINKFAEVIGL